MAKERESFEALRSSWIAFQRTAEEKATERRATEATVAGRDSPPVTYSNSPGIDGSVTSENRLSESGVDVQPKVNPEWIEAERRLRELRREQERLTKLYPGDVQLEQRLKTLIRDAQLALNLVPVSLVTTGPTQADLKRPFGANVHVDRDGEQTVDWLDLITNAGNQITPVIELHKENRRQLLAKIRQFIPAATGSTVIVGWAESSPEVVAWGRGISSQKFVLLMFLCAVLSALLCFWLSKVSALEKVHDLRELAESSAIPVIGAVHTGVVRPLVTSAATRVLARYTRRFFRLALVCYVVVFVAASLTPNGSIQSFLQNPREMLGQALLLFSSMS